MFNSERDVWSYSSTASDTRTYSPGPPLTPMELRKMSLLSSISVTIPLDQDYNIRAVSQTGCHLSTDHILPNSGRLVLIKGKLIQVFYLSLPTPHPIPSKLLRNVKIQSPRLLNFSPSTIISSLYNQTLSLSSCFTFYIILHYMTKDHHCFKLYLI